MDKLNKFVIATVLLWLFCFSGCSSLEIASYEELEKSTPGQCVESFIEKVILTLGGGHSSRDICSDPNPPRLK